MSDPGQPRRDQGASFAGATARGRARPPLFVLGFLAVLGAVVVAGFGGRTDHPDRSPAPPAAAASTGGSAALASTAPTPAGVPSVPAGSLPSPRPVVSSEPGPIVLRARRNSATVYVHGDVFAPRVTWIYVALQDAGGRVAGWTSVSMPDPGPPKPSAGDGPPMLFDVELGVPLDTYPGTIFVFAHAHDADGALVGTAQLELAP